MTRTVANAQHGTKKERRSHVMITRYTASGPIIVICSESDIDVDEARNLVRRAEQNNIPVSASAWLGLSWWISANSLSNVAHTAEIKIVQKIKKTKTEILHCSFICFDICNKMYNNQIVFLTFTFLIFTYPYTVYYTVGMDKFITLRN